LRIDGNDSTYCKKHIANIFLTTPRQSRTMYKPHTDKRAHGSTIITDRLINTIRCFFNDLQYSDFTVVYTYQKIHFCI